MSGSTRSTLTLRILGHMFPRRRKMATGARVESLESRQLLAATSQVTFEARPAMPEPRTNNGLVANASSGTANLTSPIVPLNQTFTLSSRPSATKTIYLDFDGHTTSGTSWNTTFTGGADFTTPAFDLNGDTTTFSNNELLAIQEIWARVAEDFAPFDVNVTTQDPGVANLIRSGAGDTRWGIRVVNGGAFSDWLKVPASGIAVLNSFGSSTDVPCFNFTEDQFGSLLDMADTASHETGHTLGLAHDGDQSQAYYPGHGTGNTAWAPIMGAGFGVPVSQWSKGEYPGANNQQDDLAIIAGLANGFGYRADDFGNSRLTATQLASKKVGATRTVNVSGVIGRNTDQDWFSFSTTGGTASFNFDNAVAGPNLDISVSLYDATGTLILTVNPASSLTASFSTTLTAGTYTIMIDGVGFGTLANGYSDYGSLGNYTITGSFADTSSGTANGGTSVIEGRIVSDANADGLINGSDAGIGGVMVFIDLDANGVFNAAVDKSARTDASGNYRFTGLLGGTYSVYQVVPTGFQQVTPGLGGQSVFVAADSTTSNVVFRNLRPPVLSSLGSSITYKSGSAASLITPTGLFSDPDSTTFNNAVLTVAITANADATDVLSVRNQGNGIGQVGLYGGVLRYSGVAIGSVSGGVSGSNLVIRFNSAATAPIIQIVLRNLTFVATSGSPAKNTRSLSFSITDGVGGTSATVFKSVKVV